MTNLIDLLTLTSIICVSYRVLDAVGSSSFLRDTEKMKAITDCNITVVVVGFFRRSYLDVVSGMDTHRNEKQSMELKNHLFFTLINATATAIAAITLSGWEVCLNTHSLKHTR